MEVVLEGRNGPAPQGVQGKKVRPGTDPRMAAFKGQWRNQGSLGTQGSPKTQVVRVQGGKPGSVAFKIPRDRVLGEGGWSGKPVDTKSK